MRNAFVLAAVAFAALLAAAACGGGDKRPGADELFGDAVGGDYIALGDSIADGSGSSDGAGYDQVVFGELLERVGRTAVLHHRARGGATTQDLIDEQLSGTLDTLRGGGGRRQNFAYLQVTLTIHGVLVELQDALM